MSRGNRDNLERLLRSTWERQQTTQLRRIYSKPENPAEGSRIKDYILPGSALLVEYLALRYGSAWLAWGAGVLFWFAVWDYTAARFPKNRLRIGLGAALILLIITKQITGFSGPKKVASDPSQPDKPEIPPAIAEMSIRWDRIKLPINLVESPPSSEHYVLLVKKGETIPHLSVAFSLPSPVTWPATSDRNGNLHDPVIAVTVTNQEDKGMLDIHIPFEVAFTEPHPEPSGGFSCNTGDEARTGSREWIIGSLEAHRSAIIFIVNGTEACINVTSDPQASVNVVGEGATSAKLIPVIENPADLVFTSGAFALPPSKGDWR